MNDRMTNRSTSILFLSVLLGVNVSTAGWATTPASQDATGAEAVSVEDPLSVRFTKQSEGKATEEVPDFQKHIGPLLGRLGCNGRACHGSFQGRGGFQLSLFGYDFAADHDALLDPESGRVDTTDIDESLVLAKPTDAEMHEGGKRMEMGSWQHQVLRNWIAAGAPFSGQLQTLDRLEVNPREIIFSNQDEKNALRVIAHWADGSTEEVTELCRFTTNDGSVAEINEDGLVTSSGNGDTHVVIAYDKAVVPVAVMRASTLDTAGIKAPRSSAQAVDQLVMEKLNKLKIVPSDLCNDSDFIRRASIDVTGLLPSPERVKEFLADRSVDKRARLIEELLAEPGYAAWWATRLSDWTGNSEAQLNNFFPVRGAASQYWYAWLEKRLADNASYDDIVEGLVDAETRLPSESYSQYCETMSNACRTGDEEAFAARPGVPQFWARTNFKDPEQRAVGFAYTFLGIRIQCAQCHKHPFDKWSKDDFDQFAVLFSSVQANGNTVSRDSREERDEMMAGLVGDKKLNGGELRRKITELVRDGEVVPFPELSVQEGMRARSDKNAKNKKKTPQRPQVLTGHILGESEEISLATDPRDALMQWLRKPNNPYFAKAIVNRVWSNYFGVGIVDPTDDMNLGNPPSNEPLLDYLAGEFVKSGYDLKWLHREILSSDTYQRSSQPNVTNASDKRNFSRHMPRRLPAEVIRDSVYLVTANDDEANEARKTLKDLAIGGDVSAYSRPNNRDFALQVFGQSIRETNCDCDRSEQSNLLQSIYLQNDTDIHRQLGQSSGWVAKTTLAGTGQTLRPIGNSNGVDLKQKAGTSLQNQLARRVEMFKSLSPKKQVQAKPQLVREFRRVNEKLEKLGLESVSLDSLLAVSPSTIEVEVVDSKSKSSLEAEVINGWVTEAYLRTLCRVPDQEELEIAGSFIRDSGRPGEGLESFMWTLLNTKEFILSH